MPLCVRASAGCLEALWWQEWWPKLQEEACVRVEYFWGTGYQGREEGRRLSLLCEKMQIRLLASG